MDQPVTVITGTSKGIGRHLVDHYLAKGHAVAGCSRTPMSEALAGYEHFCLDVSDESAVRAMISATSKKFGHIDHLINNAGIASTGHFLLTSAEALLKAYKTNVLGAFLFSRECAKVMKKRQSGRIVNFSTTAVPLKLQGEAVYASSKAAVVSLTEILAYELSSFGVTVNAIGPTPLKTDFIAGISEEKIQAIVDRQAIRRLATLSDITNVIDFYLRPESEFITGQVMYLGGC